MRAAVLEAPNTPLVIKDLLQDEPQYGEVRVKMGAAGICASDHHIMEGTAAFPLPSVLGHEGAGTIEAVGPGVHELKPGDRCILSFVTPCGQCSTCRKGAPQLCDLHQATGSRLLDGTVRLHDQNGREIFQMGKLGVFGEHVVTAQQACFVMPDEVPMEVAALIGCSVTTGVGAVINQPAAEAGMTVAVIGAGGVGLNAIQGAKMLNASKIIAVDIHDHKLEFARKFGATDTVNARNVNVGAAVRELSNGGVDFAFDTFGSDVTANQVFDSLGKGGTGVIVGIAPTETVGSFDLVDMVRKQKTMVGSYYGSSSPHRTFQKLVDMYTTGRIDVDSIVQRRYPLDEINEAFHALERGEDGRGVIVYD